MPNQNPNADRTRRAAIFTLAALLVAVNLASPRVAAHPRQVSAPTSEKLVRAAKKVPGRYVVQFQPNAAKDDDSFEAFCERLVMSYGGTLGPVMASIDACEAEMHEEQVAELLRDEQVRIVAENELFEAAETQPDAPWGLDRLDRRDLPLDKDYRYELDGSGVTVYVIDTGIRSDHEEFTGRVTAHDFVDDDGNIFTDAGSDRSNRPDGEDCQGHGTHVAGTIGGSTFGVAKGVDIVALRALARDANGNVACSSGRSASLAELLAAVNWVTLNHHKPAVANMSLGGPNNPLLDAAVQASILAGVTYVVAAGNDGKNAGNTSPAHLGAAITVGASDETDARADFSNFGNVVDVFAPGEDILSAGIASADDTATMEGTSMAAPHVAGVAALVLDKTPLATPAQVHNTIVSTLSTPGKVTDAGAGTTTRLLNLSEMLTPLAPERLDLRRSGTKVRLSWNDVADNETEYRVFVRTASDFVLVKTLPANSRSTTVSFTALPGMRVTFGVDAKNANGVSPRTLVSFRAPY